MFYLHKYDIIDKLSKRILRTWIIYALLFFVIYIGLRTATFVFNYHITPKFYILIPLGILISLSLVLFNYFLIKIIKRNIDGILRRKLNLIIIIPIFFLLNLLYCFIFYCFSGELFSYFYPLTLRNFLNDSEDLIVLAVISTTLLLSDLILRYNEIIKKQEGLIIDTHFKLLKSRLNPHFLFNNLNSGIGLISQSPEKAEEFFTSLAKLYRNLLEGLELDLRTVGAEIDEINEFLNLVSIKYGEVYRIKMDIPPEIYKLKIVSGALSLIFENIFKHNSFSRKKPIIIRMIEKGNFIEIINDYRPKQSGLRSFKIGQDYICRQYKERINLEPEFIKQEDVFISRLPLLELK